MDFLKFENWKNSHVIEMQDLTFAKPFDIFIFTRFTCCFHSGTQVLVAQSIEETVGYIRHIFLYDILNDATDDLETDLKSFNCNRQEDAIKLFNYWFKLGKIKTDNVSYEEFTDFCNDFNSEFSHRGGMEYEIEIFNGADELKNFLIKRYSKCESFDKKLLNDICSEELFAGKPLKDFLDMLFY